MDIKEDVKDVETPVEKVVKEVGTVDRTPKKTSEVKIRLTGAHIHEGIFYDAGEFIEVDENAARYILEVSKNGVKV